MCANVCLCARIYATCKESTASAKSSKHRTLVGEPGPNLSNQAVPLLLQGAGLTSEGPSIQIIVHTRICTNMYRCMFSFLSLSLYLYIYIYMHIVCMYVCMYACMYVYMYVSLLLLISFFFGFQRFKALEPGQGASGSLICIWHYGYKLPETITMSPYHIETLSTSIGYLDPFGLGLSRVLEAPSEEMFGRFRTMQGYAGVVLLGLRARTPLWQGAGSRLHRQDKLFIEAVGGPVEGLSALHVM